MKIADFFVQITAKGDLKEIKAILEAQKIVAQNTKLAIQQAKVKEMQIKKQIALANIQEKQEQRAAKTKKKEEGKQPKTLKDVLIANGKIFDMQRKQASLMAKGVLQTVLMKNSVAALAATFITAFVALDKMVTKLAQANQLYTNFQRQTGLPMRSALGVSGAMANLDVTMTPEQIMQNMQNLQSNLIGVQFGMGNIAPYQMAGINPFGLNPENMLDTIRKQMKGFAPAYRTFLLQQMGLDPRLGALIDLSDTEYLKYKQEALELYLSPADRKTIQELTPEWNKVNLKFTKAWDKTVLMLMQDFKGLATEIGHVIDVISKVLEVFNTILQPFLDILTFVLKPLYYLLDDIAVWLLGGRSIIGDMFHGIFPSKDEWVKILKDAFGFGNFKTNPEKMKQITDSPIGKIFGTSFGLAQLFSTGNIIPLLRTWMPKGLIGNTNNSRDISIQFNNDIKVGSPEDGYAMSDAIMSYFRANSVIHQLGGI